jgi:hypothetical protein
MMVSPSEGVLSVQLAGLTGLPHAEGKGTVVVQVVATLLQGSRREQRASTALLYCTSNVAWPEDEVLEFGGVLQSGHVFLDVYAHYGVELPGSDARAPLAVPSSSSLLGKVAICVDELEPDAPKAATRQLLVGSLEFHVRYGRVHGAAHAAARAHAPPVRIELVVPAADPAADPAVQPHVKLTRRRPSAPQAQPLAQIAPLATTESDGESVDEESEIDAQLRELVLDGVFEHETAAGAEPDRATRAQQCYRILELLASNASTTPAALLKKLARDATVRVAHRAKSEPSTTSKQNVSTLRRHSWAFGCALGRARACVIFPLARPSPRHAAAR